MGLSDALGNVGGGFIDTVKTVYDKTGADSLVNFVHVDDAGRAIGNHVLEPTLKGFNYVWENGISRPTSTLMLMQDDNVEHNMGWGGAWRESKHISPGQAFAKSMADRVDDLAQKFGIDDPLEFADTGGEIPGLGALGEVRPFFFFGDDIEKSFEELTGSGGARDFDIFNEEQRKAAFSHNFAKFLSGGSDTALRWVFDPTVVAGKAAMLLRAKYLIRALSTGPADGSIGGAVREGIKVRTPGVGASAAPDADVIASRVEEMTGVRTQTTPGVPVVPAHLPGAEAAGKLEDVESTVYEPGGRFSTSRRTREVAKRFMDMDEKNRLVALLKDKELGQIDPAIANVLARSGTVPDFEARLNTLLNPTGANIANLEARWQESFDDFAQYGDNRAQGFERSLKEAEEFYADMRMTGTHAEANIAFVAKEEAFRNRADFRAARVLSRQRKEFDELMRDATIAKAGAGPIVPPRVRLTARIGDKRAEIFNEGDQFIYQPSTFSAIRIYKSAVGTRVGTVRHDDPNSAIREGTAIMDRAGHGAKLKKGVARGLPKEQYAELLAMLTHATTLGNPTRVAEAIREVEMAVINHDAKLIGVRSDVAEALYRRFNMVRNTTIQTYSAKTGDPNSGAVRIRGKHVDDADNPLSVAPKDPAFSGARMDPTDENSPFVDIWHNETDGSYTHLPIANTDLANTTPMIDRDAFVRLMRKEKMSLNAEGDDIIAALKETYLGGDSAAYALSAWGEQTLTKFNRLWKPAQLLRAGWPIRVVVDEQMRIMAKLGAAEYMDYTTQGLGNSLVHGWAGVRVKDMALAPRRRYYQGKLDEAGPLRQEGIDKVGLIGDLDELNVANQALNQSLEMARRRLETAVGDNTGQRIYRAAPPNSPIRPDDFGTDFRFSLPPEVLEQTHVHQFAIRPDVPQERIYRMFADADPRRPGTAYLDDISYGHTRRMEDGPDDLPSDPVRDSSGYLGDDLPPPRARGHLRAVEEGETAPLRPLIQELRGATNADIRAHILDEFPDAKIAKYRTKDDLIEAYGRLVAREQGIKVITSGDGATALTRDSIVKIDPDEARARHRVEELSQEAGANATRRAELSGSMEPMRDWLRQQETDYHRILKKAVKYTQLERGHPLRPSAFSGDLVLTRNGMSISAPGAYAGALGNMFVDLTSAASTTRALTGTEERYLRNLRLTGGDQLTVSAYVDETMDTTTKKLRTATYDSGWETAANRQIGQDAMLRQIVTGHSDDEILEWMRTTGEGRNYINKAPSQLRENAEEWVARARVHVDHYLPTPEIRAAALEGTARAKDIRDWAKLEGRQPPTVHGQSLDLVAGKGAGDVAIGRWADRLYAALGTAPTDVLSRQPFFAAVYKKEMQRQFDARAFASTDEVTQEVINSMQSNARNFALKEVKKTLYDVANQSNLGHAMRFAMPFYAAWQDALQTWSRLWMEDPSRLARMAMAWNAPTKSASLYESPDGTKYMATPLPNFVKKRLGLENSVMPANALKGLIAQGDYWYMPGFGAPVAVPVGVVARERPDLATLLAPVIPFGAGEGVWDQILPAGWKRGKSLFNEEDDADYSKALVRMSQDVYVENRQKKLGMTDQQMWDEAKRRTNSLFTARMAANFTLPFSPKMNSPYQFYIDEWRTMQEKFRTDPQVFGGKSAQDNFIDTHGEDYFIFTLAATKSNVGGIAPTVEGYQAFNEYKDLIRQFPEMGSLIAGDTTGEYSSEVATWMQDQQIGAGDTTHLRDVRDPETAFKDAEVNRGWALYRQLETQVDAALAERGLKSLRSTGAADIKALRDVAVRRIKEQYGAWGEEFGTFDRAKADRRVAFMEKLVEDPRIREREGFGSLVQYLEARRQLTRALAARPSQNLQAQENSDLRALWDVVVNRLRQGDTKFAELHTRWLNSDDLDTGGLA